MENKHIYNEIYNLKYQNIKKIIHRDIDVQANQDIRSVNIRDILTAATLSKKFFFGKHYNVTNYPIYTLKESIDEYIRQSYRGGRTELFFKLLF